MIHTIDRVQYIKGTDEYYFYEFMEVTNIDVLLDERLSSSEFWYALFEMISEPEKNKINFLKNIEHVVRVYIFHQKGHEKYIKIEINSGKIRRNIWSFDELKGWFKKLNNIDGQSNSKKLGAVRSTDIDNYVISLLKSIYENEQFHDDNGLELTKRLLETDSTKGFDLDLFQFIPSTNEYIIYEFLKRESKFINNIQAHPMRYCWTGKWNDNKQKFISLWKTKELFNGRLLLVNYSDDSNERISIIEILDLDIDQGIMAEKKYSMSKNVFLAWLKDMNQYGSTQKNYFIDFKFIEYDKKFFTKFIENKGRYGDELM